DGPPNTRHHKQLPLLSHRPIAESLSVPQPHGKHPDHWAPGPLEPGWGLVAGPGEDGPARPEGDRGTDGQVVAADDADHNGAVVRGVVGLHVDDGVVAVVAER